MDTKDKIEFKITKKVKFWLSFILCAILVAITTTVLVVRASNLNNTNRASTTTESSTGNSSGGTSHPERNSAETDPLDPSINLAHSDTTSALVTLKNIGGIYQTWFGKYLSSDDIVSTTKLDMSNTNFTLLESCAHNILQTIESDYTSIGKSLSADNITDSDNLQTYVNDFKELLNNIEK